MPKSLGKSLKDPKGPLKSTWISWGQDAFQRKSTILLFVDFAYLSIWKPMPQKEKERVRELSIFCYAGIDTADMFQNNFSVKELYRKKLSLGPTLNFYEFFSWTAYANSKIIFSKKEHST